MSSQPVALSSEELEELRELNDVRELINSSGWKLRIHPLLKELVEEAHEAMVGNLSNDPMSYMRLQLRWQQREAILRAVEAYIADSESRRKRILEEIENRRIADSPSGVPAEEHYA